MKENQYNRDQIIKIYPYKDGETSPLCGFCAKEPDRAPLVGTPIGNAASDVPCCGSFSCRGPTPIYEADIIGTRGEALGFIHLLSKLGHDGRFSVDDEGGLDNCRGRWFVRHGEYEMPRREEYPIIAEAYKYGLMCGLAKKDDDARRRPGIRPDSLDTHIDAIHSFIAVASSGGISEAQALSNVAQVADMISAENGVLEII